MIAVAAAGLVLAACAAAAARGSGHGGGNAKSRGGAACVQAASAPYKENCGACHMAYPAALLPEASWRNILGGLDDHFGAGVSLEADGRAQVEAYLFPNAADRGGTRLGARIMACLGSQAPDRISTLPFLQRVHRKAGAAVSSGQDGGGFKDCTGCHADAEQGGFGKGRR